LIRIPGDWGRGLEYLEGGGLEYLEAGEGGFENLEEGEAGFEYMRLVKVDLNT
jgi:hypothetical protein